MLQMHPTDYCCCGETTQLMIDVDDLLSQHIATAGFHGGQPPFLV
jgi:hypothetical protein